MDKPDNLILEIFVIDGNSTDKTKEIVTEYTGKDERIKVLDNPGIYQSSALNIGLQKAKGEYICRLDAHSDYAPDYLNKLIRAALETAAANVGGIFITKSGGTNYSAQIVQAISTHRFGVGNSGFRTGAAAGYADTVPYGFYRRSLFEKIGLFDVRLVRAQDYELNRRIIKAGGKIWCTPEIQINYYNQSFFLKFLKKQFFFEAPYNAYMWYLAPYTFAYRHAITGVFAGGVIGGVLISFFSFHLKWIFLSIMVLYFLLALVSSVQQAFKFKKILHVFTLPLSFFLYHFIHGVGLLAGLLRLLFCRAPVQKINEPWPGAGRFRAWRPGMTIR